MLVRDDPKENAANDGFRGSLPPSGQTLPDLSAIDGMRPAVPTPAKLAGAPVLLVATCLQCQSGDVFGGFVARLAERDLPHDARLVVVGWNGSAADWKRAWNIGDDVEVHEAVTPEATARVRALLRVGESGIAFAHDGDGRWKSSFAYGQINVEDVLHDLDVLGSD